MAVDLRLIQRLRPRTSSALHPGWLASQLGWIRSGSGSAWPDPACPSFFPFSFSLLIQNPDYVLYFKLVLKCFKPQKIVKQIL
jgi:hypothetical protein